MILLSIITPTYNPGNWLDKCIQNVADNLPPGTEHLIIDGGSSDGTAEKLAGLAKMHPHLRWISEKDKGQSDAMNKGLKMARGKWVGFLNADDFYEKGTLKKVLSIFQENPGQEKFLFANLNVLNEKDELISVNKPSFMSMPLLLADICEWPYNPAAYFYPKSLHDKIGIFPADEHFAMDYDFILRMMHANYPLAYFNQVWGNFRLQPEAKTVKDQAADQSFQRASALRRKYYLQSGIFVRITTKMLVFLWALRNIVLGFSRKLKSGQ